MTPDHFIDNVRRGTDGIWRTSTQSPVSYSEIGHVTCHGVEDDSFWFSHRNRCIAAVVDSHRPDPSLSFVDIGGGNGFVSRMLQDQGYAVVMVEPGAEGVANARARGIRDLVHASMSDLAVRPQSLGAVGMFDVLEHIEDDAAALRTIRGMLVEEGKLYVTVPAHRWLWSNADEEAGHYRRYRRKELIELFEASGLEVEFCTYYFWLLPIPLFLFRSLLYRIGCGRLSKPRAKRMATEHRRKGGVIERLLSRELALLRSNTRIPCGASCILVASRRSRSRVAPAEKQ